MQGLTFVDGGDFDPASPRDVFSGSKHFKIDYSRPPGQEWSYAGSTLNRFAYPDDPAFHLPKGVRGEPMVCTPQDAYRCFMRTEMDYLVMGNYLLDKRDQPKFTEEADWKTEFKLD